MYVEEIIMKGTVHRNGMFSNNINNTIVTSSTNIIFIGTRAEPAFSQWCNAGNLNKEADDARRSLNGVMINVRMCRPIGDERDSDETEEPDPNEFYVTVHRYMDEANAIFVICDSNSDNTRKLLSVIGRNRGKTYLVAGYSTLDESNFVEEVLNFARAERLGFYSLNLSNDLSNQGNTDDLVCRILTENNLITQQSLNFTQSF